MTAANPTLRPHPLLGSSKALLVSRMLNLALLAGKVDSVEKKRLDVMDSIKKYKPNLVGVFLHCVELNLMVI